MSIHQPFFYLRILALRSNSRTGSCYKAPKSGLHRAVAEYYDPHDKDGVAIIEMTDRKAKSILFDIYCGSSRGISSLILL